MAKKVIKHKAGNLSREDKAKIEEWCTQMDTLDIAQRLNRPLKTIERYRNEYLAHAPTLAVKRTEAEEFKRELHANSNWETTKKQFTGHEIIFYENKYIEYRQHFKDMTSMELTQLHQLITLDIFLVRHNISSKQNHEEIERLNKILNKEKSKDPASLNADDKAFIGLHEDKLAALKAVSKEKSAEYTNLNKQHGDLMKSLKGTRDQRIKNNEDQGKFITLLYKLEQESQRTPIVTENALAEMAKQKELERLSQPYSYNDKTIDVPVYNWKTADNLE